MTSLPSRWFFGDSVEPLQEVLTAGGVLAIPTESSYGLAVDPASAEGVAAVYRIKGRPSSKPLPVVIGDREQLRLLGADPLTIWIQPLADLWPGPLSVVVPIKAPIAASAGEMSVAVRIPGHESLRALLLDLGHPLTATSANASGTPAITDPREVVTLLAGVPSILVDGGKLAGGLPSTLVAWEGDRIRVLREGACEVSTLRRRVPWPVVSTEAAENPADDPLRSK